MLGQRLALSKTRAVAKPDGNPFAAAYLGKADPSPYMESRDIDGIEAILVTQAKPDEAAGEEGQPNQAETGDPKDEQRSLPSQEGQPQEEAAGKSNEKTPEKSGGATPAAGAELPDQESVKNGDSGSRDPDTSVSEQSTVTWILLVTVIFLVTAISILTFITYRLYALLVGPTKIPSEQGYPESGPPLGGQNPGRHPQLEEVRDEIVTIQRSLSEVPDRIRTLEVRLESLGRSVKELSYQVARQATTSPSVPVGSANRAEGKASGARGEAVSAARSFDQTRGPGGRPGPGFKRDATNWQEEIDRRLRRLSDDYNDLLEERADLKRFLAEWQPRPVALTNFEQRVKEPGIGPELSIQDEPIGQAGELFWWVSAGTDNRGYVLPAHQLFKRRTALRVDTAAPIFQSIFEVVSAGRYAVERPATAEINEPKVIVKGPGILHVV